MQRVEHMPQTWPRAAPVKLRIAGRQAGITSVYGFYSVNKAYSYEFTVDAYSS